MTKARPFNPTARIRAPSSPRTPLPIASSLTPSLPIALTPISSLLQRFDHRSGNLLHGSPFRIHDNIGDGVGLAALGKETANPCQRLLPGQHRTFLGTGTAPHAPKHRLRRSIEANDKISLLDQRPASQINGRAST